MKLKAGDKVKVISGKNKGTESEIERVIPHRNLVVVKGVNEVTKHVKGSAQREGGLIKVTKPVDVSNVMLIDSDSKEPTRIGYKIVDGKKHRISKKSGKIIEDK